MENIYLRKNNIAVLKDENTPETLKLQILESGKIGLSSITDLYDMIYSNILHTTFINKVLSLMSDDGLKDLVDMICFIDDEPGKKDRELVKTIGKNINLREAALERGWELQYAHNYIDLFGITVDSLDDECYKDIDEEVFIYILSPEAGYNKNHVDVVASMLANSNSPISSETLYKLFDLIMDSSKSIVDSYNINKIVVRYFETAHVPKLIQFVECFCPDVAIESKYYWFLYCISTQSIYPLLQKSPEFVLSVLSSAMTDLRLAQMPAYQGFFIEVLKAMPQLVVQLLNKQFPESILLKILRNRVTSTAEV